ncbi:MAG: fibronectin type III domain-containing protein [Oscillospiraceae bacterium]|nr:fibronectin type III domain-containing protein [Oscillospiraceae bacterium]
MKIGNFAKLKRISAVFTALALVLIMIPTAAAEDFIPVTDIMDGPTNAVTGTPLTLNATVFPFEAAQEIIWTVNNAGTTGATINGAIFNATSAGTAEVTATAGGFSKVFPITVEAAFVPVANIANIPANQTVGSFPLDGVVEPENATNKGIIWTVVTPGTTGASIAGTTLTTTNTGDVLIRASIANGLANDAAFVKEFSITIGTQTITSASVQVSAPETFGKRPEAATTPTNANYTVSSVTWRVGSTAFSGASFVGSTRYTADVRIAAKPGFVFAEGAAFTGNINSNRAALTRNNDGTITMAFEFSATRAASVLPTAPQNFKAEGGNNQVRLTWTAPTNSGGSSITRYQVSYGLSANYVRNWEDIRNSNAATTSYTVTGLENDMEYTFELRAVNSPYGGGIETPAIKEKPIGTATVPQNFRVSPGNGNVLISWTPPSFTGGTITAYEFSYAPAGSYAEEWQEVPRSGSGSSVPLSYLLTEVTNGVEYTFQIRAVNANGEGVASEKVNGMPAVNVLSAPRSFTATAGNEQVVLAWTAPQSTGGNNITRYQYSQLTTSGTPAWKDIPDSGATTTSYTITGLTNGTTYFFEVRAISGTTVQGSTSGVRLATPAAPISNSTTSVDNRASDIQTAANNNTGQNITVAMTAGSNSISKAVLDSIRGKNVNIILDFGAVGRVSINGESVNNTNGAATLNLNLQRASGTTTMLTDYNIPKANIDARNPLPVHQLKIGTGAAVAISGTATVNVGDANSGRNAILCKYNADTKEFEVVSSAVITSNGSAAINFTSTGDYVVIVQRDGDVTGTGAVETGDALEILRAVAGIVKLDSVQMHVASSRRDGTVTSNDALVILRRVAGFIEIT